MFKPGQSGNPSGKPVGAKNKATAELRDILDSVVDWNVAAGKLWSLGQGILIQEKKADGSVEVYEKPPNEYALKTLFEFRFGKAKQSVDVTSNGQTIFNASEAVGRVFGGTQAVAPQLPSQVVN